MGVGGGGVLFTLDELEKTVLKNSHFYRFLTSEGISHILVGRPEKLAIEKFRCRLWLDVWWMKPPPQNECRPADELGSAVSLQFVLPPFSSSGMINKTYRVIQNLRPPSLAKTKNVP